jgi:DNA-binding transcriptional ArsR family regulator
MNSMRKKFKTTKQLERYFKGVANHRRLEILKVVAQNQGISVEEIAEELKTNFKTISGHTHNLTQAGLINKKYQGRRVLHYLSPYGRIFYNFIKKFQHS